MKLGIIILCLASASCQVKTKVDASENASLPLAGTWKLISGTTIDSTDTVVTNYTKGQSFIKIINNSHFAFLQHDLQKGKDSAASFSAGGGYYSLKDSLYTEHLEYCSAREWEENHFDFVVSIHNDTLVQKGVEKVDKIGVNRINIEKYVRMKD